MKQTSTPIRIAVVGGGISGLAAAHHLLEEEPDAQVTLFEAADRVGGVVTSVQRDGYLIEGAADMFMTKEPWAMDLCRRIGFEDQLVETNEGKRRAFVVRRGHLYPVPEGFTLMTPVKAWPMIVTPLLSPWGKLRLACEYVVPARRSDEDESLESFTTRRMGREAYDRLIQPLISSIYTADPTKLSMRAAMPQFFTLEQKYGSVARGMKKMAKARKTKSTSHGTGARYGLFVGARHGLETLIRSIAERLPADSIRLNAPVHRIEHNENGTWSVWASDSEQPEDFHGVILATPAPRTADLVAPLDPQMANQLRSIPLAGTTIVALGYRRDQIAHSLDGFGAVIPLTENRKVLSISFSSIKFDGRAPKDRVLFRVFVGGACQAELAELPDEPLQAMVEQELRELLGIQGSPELCELFRWPATMPQYHVGHLDRVAEIEGRAAELSCFALAGNAYRGVGLPFCIRSGEKAARRVLEAVKQQYAEEEPIGPNTPRPGERG